MKTDISNSARSADGSQCSVLGPPVTACMQMLHEEELEGDGGGDDDASGLLPRLSGTEQAHTHTHTQMTKLHHRLPFLRRRPFRKTPPVQFGRFFKSAADYLVSCPRDRKKAGEPSASNRDCAVGKKKENKRDTHRMHRPGLTQQSCHRARREMSRMEVTARSRRLQDRAAAGISITTRDRRA